MRGHVKMYDPERGWGFIRPDDLGPDVRVEGPPSLNRHDLVSFDVVAGEPDMNGVRRKIAVNVRVIE